MRELHLFAGAGGGILGGQLLGHECVCAVELEEYPRRVLLQRQRDGLLPWFPVWDDVRTFDGRPWRGHVDIVCGGFPCQDCSPGSSTRTGIYGERSGLWSEFARVIRETQPDWVFVENSPNLIHRGIGRVLSDLAVMGFDARWGVLGAHHLGFPHERNRLWIVAHSNKVMGTPRAWAFKQHEQLAYVSEINKSQPVHCESLWLEMASKFSRMDDGLANKLDRTEAIGNGQVPAVAALAWRVLGGE